MATEFVPDQLPVQESPQSSGAAGKLRVWPRILWALVCFAGLEGILFHTSLYSSIIEPDSTTGSLEIQLRNEIKRPKPNRNQVLAVGHSRMALLPRIANQMQPPTGYTFGTIGLGGTAARDWYYSLRAVDPTAHQYAAIVIPCDDYNEPDSYDYQSEREADLHYLIARLGWRDLFDFPWTYNTPRLRWLAIRGLLLKGYVYKRDFEEFLDHPRERIAKVRYYDRDSFGWYYGFGGTDESLAGMEIDWQHKVIHFPDRVTAAQRESIHSELFPDPGPQDGSQTAYLRYWYGRIVDYYRGSGTKIFFLRVPRAPSSPPDPPARQASAVRQLAGKPGVIVLDEHLFDPIERPELFWDGLHLNHDGMDRFSEILATAVRQALGPPRS